MLLLKKGVRRSVRWSKGEETSIASVFANQIESISLIYMLVAKTTAIHWDLSNATLTSYHASICADQRLKYVITTVIKIIKKFVTFKSRHLNCKDNFCKYTFYFRIFSNIVIKLLYNTIYRSKIFIFNLFFYTQFTPNIYQKN